MGRAIGGNTLSLLSRFAPARAGATSVELLEPPYEGLVPVSLVAGRGPSLGTVAVARGRDPLAALGALTLVVDRWPWLVPALTITVDERATRDALLLVSPPLAWRVVLLADGRPLPADVVNAVRQRPFPGPIQLANYMVDRIGRSDLTEALTAQFERALNGRPLRLLSSATYSRLFRTVGAFTARDWRALAVLLRELHRRQAGRAGTGLVSQRTLLAYVRRLLGATCTASLDRLGWEWMVEEGLRRGRIITRPLRSRDWFSA